MKTPKAFFLLHFGMYMPIGNKELAACFIRVLMDNR